MRWSGPRGATSDPVGVTARIMSGGGQGREHTLPGFPRCRCRLGTGPPSPRSGGVVHRFSAERF
ncbi:hypothetical protein BQ8420_28195 [Nocardiopsis sp. JB363]|nr:hypothetical protein BQ8420_28195 [Nocardiopsis sp. JB363]